MAATGERAVAGRTSRLIGPHEQVTWEAHHLRRRWRLTVRIIAFDPPRHFRDVMVRGPFGRFVHDHRFASFGGATTMVDEVEFASPLGPLGALADWLVVRRHLATLLANRAEALRCEAERQAAS